MPTLLAGNLQITEALVEAGADKTAKTAAGKTPLDFALETKRNEWQKIASLLSPGVQHWRPEQD